MRTVAIAEALDAGQLRGEQRDNAKSEKGGGRNTGKRKRSLDDIICVVNEFSGLCSSLNALSVIF